MSKNLLKQFCTVVADDEKRMIDTNALVQKRLDELEEKLQEKQSQSFVAGLVAEEIALPEGEEESEERIIKAKEDSRELIERAKEEADNILAQAKAEAVRIHDESLAQTKTDRNRILIEAKEQGYAEGMERANATEQSLIREYQDKEAFLEEQYLEKIENIEPILVETITDIYEHIFHVELRTYREILSFLISSSLRKIDGGHDFIIHVSKEDYPYISMQKKQLLKGISTTGNLEIIEDITLNRNECLIETENGIFDCGLDTQLGELTRRIRLLSWTKEE